VGFTVLFVCTGNICRSPSAERIFAAQLDPAGPIAVASAGTGAVVGHGIDEPTALVLGRLGADPSGHRAQQLTGELLAGSDLVLTAESSHRAAVLQAQPLGFRQTFTIREFGRLGAGLPPLPAPPGVEALRERVAEVAARRGIVAVAEPGADEIGDPFGAGNSAAATTVAQIARAVEGVVAALGLRPARRPDAPSRPG
jgi:protein-tyrosine phosphatase